MLPIATFLAGSLLTLLVPVLLLIALVVWYWKYVEREPDPAEPPDAGSPPEGTGPPSREAGPMVPPAGR